MGRSVSSTCLALLATAAVAGCGGSGDGSGAGGTGGTPTTNIGTPGTGPYQPLAVGAAWSYHVNDQGVVYDKASSVEAMEDIGGSKAGISGYKVRETVKDAIQLTWYQVTDSGVVRHHDQMQDTGGQLLSDEWYDPFLRRTDETTDHLKAGATWVESYTNTKTTTTKPTATISHQETWTTEATDESITVPAGTFTALKITRTDPTDSQTKTQWFVRGVGKVREQTGAGHIEELTSYQVPGQ
jgi:hypothetical protein